MSKFDHLKKRPRSLDDFISGANSDEKAKKARKRPSKDSLLLVVSGRGSLEHYGKSTLIYIRKDIQEDMEKYCSGSKQGIINYLLRRGLDELIKEGVRIIEEPA